MASYLLRRTAMLLLSLAVAVTVLFLVLRLLGNPVYALISIEASPEDVAAAAAALGVDRPIGVQFLDYLGALLRGDLGTSFSSHQPIGPEILRRLNVTVPLTLASFALSILIAVPVGFISAWKSQRWYGTALSALSQLGGAIPVFWVGILLVGVFALWARVLPAGGFPRRDWADPGAAITSLVLPVLAIALISGSELARYIRSATLDILDRDYVRTARSLGQSFPRAMLRHGLPNGAVPVISILAIQLSTTFVGAVIVENVFALPGLGDMLLTGIRQQDFPSVQGVLLFSTLLVLLSGFAGDILQRVLDPRLRGSLSLARTGGAR